MWRCQVAEALLWGVQRLQCVVKLVAVQFLTWPMRVCWKSWQTAFPGFTGPDCGVHLTLTKCANEDGAVLKVARHCKEAH